MQTVFILNGPNLNLLGKRQPEIYGRETLADVETACRSLATEFGFAIRLSQSNAESQIIDWIHEARDEAAGIGAFLALHGGDRDDLNMRGALLHVMGDLLGSVAALVAAGVIMATGWYPIDPILSVLVALLLFRSAFGLVRDAGHVLLEGTPAGIDRDAVMRDLVASVSDVRDVHHMHVWSLDGSRNMATLHARLDPGADAQSAIAAIKRRLAAIHGIRHATVEVEYESCADRYEDEAQDHDHEHEDHDDGDDDDHHHHHNHHHDNDHDHDHDHDRD